MADIIPLRRPLASNYSQRISLDESRRNHPSSYLETLRSVGELLDMDEELAKLSDAGARDLTLRLVRPGRHGRALWVLSWSAGGRSRSVEASSAGVALRRAHAATESGFRA